VIKVSPKPFQVPTVIKYCHYAISKEQSITLF
jgi:hypothetical protein